MKAIILAGGSGTRLWPLSRKDHPKQFLKLYGDKSLLQWAVERLLGVVRPEDIIVITNSDYKFLVLSELNSLSAACHSSLVERIVLEPLSRNTAPAIALGIKYCIEKLGCSGDEVVFISSSDHIIQPADGFAEYISRAEEVAKEGYIATLGIRPTRAETGYGYIKVSSEELSVRSENSVIDCFKVDSFKEKPDMKTAEQYVESGDYYWNSGMFAFSIKTMTEEMHKHADGIKRMLGMNFEEMLSDFGQMPNVSIDYAVMEKSDRVALLPLDLHWNDIGSWDSLYDIMERDENNNAIKGDVLALDTRGSLIFGNKRHISTIGLEDCLVIEVDDALLIAKRGESQKVKDIVDRLKRDGRQETEGHATTYRPWGDYTVLEDGARYKIKRIVVNPGERLSLQMHHHRSEHWVVVKGTARATVGDKEVFIHENESAYVPKSTLHRLENPGKIPLEIIEVQNGEYVGEDDIKRYDDIYGRHIGEGSLQKGVMR